MANVHDLEKERRYFTEQSESLRLTEHGKTASDGHARPLGGFSSQSIVDK